MHNLLYTVLFILHPAEALRLAQETDLKCGPGQKNGENLKNAVYELQNMSPEQLRNVSRISDIIRKIGLVAEDGRQLYGDEKQFTIPSTSVHGRPGLFQLPEQMACTLVQLSSRNIESFLEVGTWSGWTSIFMKAFLQAVQPHQQIKSTAIDIRDARADCAKSLMEELGHPLLIRDKKKATRSGKRHNETKRKEGFDGLLDDLPTKIDLCFVDGDHSYDGVHSDVEALQEHCKYFMLHDIVDQDCPGVAQQWRELEKKYGAERAFTCVQQPGGLPVGSSRLGIGVIKTGI